MPLGTVLPPWVYEGADEGKGSAGADLPGPLTRDQRLRQLERRPKRGVNPASEGAPGTGVDAPPAGEETASKCNPARVRYTPYPGGDERLDGIPWLEGQPRESGLVALLWYWPEDWQRQRLHEGRIFTGGVAPAGYNVKILWAFVAPSAKGRGGGELVVEGHRLGRDDTFRQEFAAISYEGQEGAPSYASIIDVPKAGCWRLDLSTGDLQASVVLRAVPGEK
jgi:hypothetical protein